MDIDLFSEIEDRALDLIPANGRVLLGVGAPLRLLPRLPSSTIVDVEAGTLSTSSSDVPTYMGEQELFDNSKRNIGINNFFTFWTRKVPYDAVVLEVLEIDKNFNVNVDQIDDRVFGGRGGAAAALKLAKQVILLPSKGRASFLENVSVESYCLRDCLPPGASARVVFPDDIIDLM